MVMCHASICVKEIYQGINHHVNDRSRFYSCIPFLVRNGERAVVNVNQHVAPLSLKTHYPDSE